MLPYWTPLNFTSKLTTNGILGCFRGNLGPEIFHWIHSTKKLELTSCSAARMRQTRLSGRLCVANFNVGSYCFCYPSKMFISASNSLRSSLYWYQDPEGHVFFLKRAEEDKQSGQFNLVFWKVTPGSVQSVEMSLSQVFSEQPFVS